MLKELRESIAIRDSLWMEENVFFTNRILKDFFLAAEIAEGADVSNV